MVLSIWQRYKNQNHRFSRKNTHSGLQPIYDNWHLYRKFEPFKHLIMKKIILSVFSLSLGIICLAQTGHEGHGHEGSPTTTTPATVEVLKLKETEYDFGKIPQGKPVFHSFEVVNISNVPQKIENVVATCGCTTPEWSKEPIAPGATAKIKVGYNAVADSYFEKFITITYNNNQTRQIKIKGTVWKAPETSAPGNASVDLLKKQTF
jgi:hypothetical protein